MILGITGGIGSGKSTVARIFETLGYPVFRSDDVAKDIYLDTAVKQKVIALLGNDVYTSNTEINKILISSLIFNDPELLKKLNAILHPAVGEKFENFKRNHQSHKIIIKETALLFEAKVESQVDKILVVVADDALRINRVMNRDNLSKEQVEKKIKNQLSQEEKIKRSHFVIYNDENQFLTTQVIALIKQILTS
jgi:dephospho-CoA kinase